MKKNKLKTTLISKVGNGTNHFLINGDNLEVLEAFAGHNTNLPADGYDYSDSIDDHFLNWENKIDLIYIDPPYNTGKKMGKYNDNFSSHDNWTEFMRPRLMYARRMLSDNGLIFISIGENEEAYLKILCNSIFGEENKVSSIIWQSKYTVANDKVGISAQIEYILVYAKNIKNININSDPLRQEYVEKTYKNIDNDPRGNWRGGVQLYKKKNKHSYTVTAPNGKKWTMPWNYSEERWYNFLVKNDLIYWGKDGNSCPVKKVFLKDSKGIGIKNLWLGSEVGYTADGGETLENMFGDRNKFLYPKPVSLMKRILQIASKPNSLVMDFFAGSGTFGQAVLECNKEDNGNRNCILITNNENNICDNTTFPRLKKVIEGYVGKDNKMYEGTGGKLFYMKLA